MNCVRLLQPPRIVIGAGCAPQCADYLLRRGVRRVLIVSSNSVKPLLHPIRAPLEQAGVAIINAPPVAPEPTLGQFNKVLEFARAASADAVLGVGGGSAIDVAKLVAALSHSAQSAKDVFGVDLLSDRTLPLVCLPTTAGTGAEVSPNAVLLNEDLELKQGVISPHLVPDAAFIDPLLALSVPPAVTAATGLDALTHCIEGFANNSAHPVVDVYALQGIQLIAGALERVVHHGTDLEARTQMALGSFYGGLCLGPVNTAAVHALAYPLGGRFRVAHGVSNAVLLPEVLRFSLPAAPERYAEIAVALGASRESDHHSTALRGVDLLVALSRRCGVPQRLSELGVPHDAIPWMAASAMQVQRLLKNNPRPVTETDAAAIYTATY